MRVVPHLRFGSLIAVAVAVLACGDDDAPNDPNDAGVPADAGHFDARIPAPTDASLEGGPSAGSTSTPAVPDAGPRPECARPDSDPALAQSLCECREPDAAVDPFFFFDDAGSHFRPPESWRVSLDCMCALGYCGSIARARVPSGPTFTHCGCGKIEIRDALAFGFQRRTYDLVSLELIGTEATSDTNHGVCDEIGYVAGEVDLSACPDYRECDLPASVAPCPVPDP